MDMPAWINSRVMNPREAAQLYCDETYGAKRTVNQNTVQGNWIGRDFSGSFMLQDGVRILSLRYDSADKLWKVFT